MISRDEKWSGDEKWSCCDKRRVRNGVAMKM